MDEENNEERRNNQKTKDIQRKVKNKAKDYSKKVFKAIIRAIGIKGIAIVLAIVLIITTLSIIWYGVKDVVYESISEIAKSVTKDDSGNISKITKINGRKYEIDTTELNERLNKWFKNNKVSKEQIGLSNDLSGLKEFLEAEVVTSCPDLRERNKIGSKVPDGEIQGCVQFHRRLSDGTTKILEYMAYEEFAGELAKVGIVLDDGYVVEDKKLNKDEVTKLYNKLEGSFTINSREELIVVNIVSTDKKVVYSDYAKQEGHTDGDADEYIYDIEITQSNYKSVIQKYTMPFEFCLALLMTSQNYEFCKAVAELAKDSTIIIDVQDNVTTNVTTEVYSFDVQFELERYITYEQLPSDTEMSRKETYGEDYKLEGKIEKYDPYPIEGEASANVNPYKTTTNTLQNNNIKLCVRQAKTWIADYNSDYTNKVENPEIEDIISTEPDDSSFTEVPDYHGNLAALTYQLPEGAYIIENRGVVKEKKYNKKTVISTAITTNEYYKSNMQIEETPEKFLSLLKVDPSTGIFDVENLRNNSKVIYYKNIGRKETSSPEDNIISAEYVLYELLASNSKTVQLEDTMRYLINVYKGRVKARKAEDFEIYVPEEFEYIDGTWSALWKNNYTKEQFIQWVKNYTPPNGKGNNGRDYKEYYQKHFITNAENYFDIATSFGLDPMFIFCIGIHESAYGTSNISYDKGNFWGWGAYDSTPYQSALSFVGDASKGIESVCEGLANNYVQQSGQWFDWIKSRGYDPTTIDGIGVRYASDSSWAAIIKTHITNIFGVSGVTEESQIELAGDSARRIVQWAELQIGKSSFYNKERGGNYASKKYCAAFVKSAYNEAGLGYINGNAINIPHSNPIEYNSTGKVDYTKIPVGACIVSKGSNPAYGHVALYVGNGYVIEAGGRTIVKQKIDESYGRTYGFLGWGYATTSGSM